jgi:hypothetical protein
MNTLDNKFIRLDAAQDVGKTVFWSARYMFIRNDEIPLHCSRTSRLGTYHNLSRISKVAGSNLDQTTDCPDRSLFLWFLWILPWKFREGILK